MDEGAVLSILGLAGAAFSTLWATGGWRALRLRRIKQEIDIANGPPADSKAKAALLGYAEEQRSLRRPPGPIPGKFHVQH
jgi:hypothetical protein